MFCVNKKAARLAACAERRVSTRTFLLLVGRVAFCVKSCFDGPVPVGLAGLSCGRFRHPISECPPEIVFGHFCRGRNHTLDIVACSGHRGFCHF